MQVVNYYDVAVCGRGWCLCVIMMLTCF